MGEIKSKKLTLRELNQKVYALQSEIESKQYEIENLNKQIERYAVLNVSDNLSVHRFYKSSTALCSILIKQGDTNVCKMYGTVKHKMKHTTLLAKQITLLPRLLKIVSRIVDGEYSYNLEDECKELLYQASSDSIDWVSVTAPRNEHRYVLQNKQKEVEA